MKGYYSVREYCEKEGMELSIGEIVIIQNMMRIEADDVGAVVHSMDDVPLFHERMLCLYFNM